MTTIRYRSSEGRLPYAHAVLSLTEYARSSGTEFDFGPDTWASMELNGLAVTGDDLEFVTRLLDKVAGLYRSDE